MNDLSDQEIRQLLHNTLNQNAYWQVNKKITLFIGGRVGRDASLLLSDLISKEKYFHQLGKLNQDGFFFNSQSDIERDTTLTPYEQRRTLEVLEANELIETKLKRIGNGDVVKHFRVNHPRILKILISDNKEILSPDPKSFDIDKSNNKDNKNKGIGSKEPINDVPSSSVNRTRTKEPKKEEGKPSSLFVEEWNKNSAVSKHLNPSTKTYQRAVQICGYLMAGNFHRFCPQSRDRLEKWKFPIEATQRKYSQEQIIQAIQDLALLYTVGYLPHDKKSLPKNFSDALYNPRTQYSWILSVLINPPRPIADSVECRRPDEIPRYKKIIPVRGNEERFNVALIKGINFLAIKQREIEKALLPYMTQHSEFCHRFGPRGFWDTHFDWMNKVFSGKEINPQTIIRSWGAFVQWTESFYGYSIEPDDDQYRQIKQSHRKWVEKEETKKRMREDPDHFDPRLAAMI